VLEREGGLGVGDGGVGGQYPELDVLEPRLLSGNETVTFHRVDVGMLLTGDGENLIVSHSIR
jgi:hypothetical protein